MSSARESPPLIDSHCHLEAKDFSRPTDEGVFDEREEVIERARDAGLVGMVCVGMGGSLDEVKNAVAMAERHPDIWATIGIHPHDAARVPEGALAEIERLAAHHPRVVAVGETGLDYHYGHSPREAQQDLLRAFVQMGRRTRKPISLHIRSAEPARHPGASASPFDAHAEAARLLHEEKIGEVGGVVHCFTGTPTDAERYLALGLYISFSGVLTFKSAQSIRDAALLVPLNRLLVETDCPYLAPVPHRGKRNEPAHIAHTAQLLAELRGLSASELASHTVANARRLFSL